MSTPASMTQVQTVDKAPRKERSTRTQRPHRARTNLLRGNFQLFNEVGNLKLFSEPNDGRKGVVFENNNKVMDAFPRVKELVVSDGEAVGDLTDEMVAQSSFYDHHEGALIRVYYAEGGWKVSTQKKIDAFRSRWSGSMSFGELWSHAIKMEMERKPALFNHPDNHLLSFFNTLDQEKKYLFIIRHNEDNRIVCKAPENPTVYHVGTYIKNVIHPDDDINITKPTAYRFPTVDALRTHVLSLDSAKVSGCLGAVKGARVNNRPIHQKWYKIQNEEYSQLEKVRGNEPSLRFRYLQVRLDANLVDDLFMLFPSHSAVFDECEDSIYAIAKYIHRAYMDRFIRRQFVTLEREFFTIMRLCHDWHKEDRQNNKVDLDKVIEVLNTRYDHVLNKMIRMHKIILEGGSAPVEPRQREEY
jgi:hypothetical protein